MSENKKLIDTILSSKTKGDLGEIFRNAISKKIAEAKEEKKKEIVGKTYNHKKEK